MTEVKRGFPWGLTVASTLLFAVLMSLGVWQVQRLQWKEGLIAQAGAASALPPAPLAQVLASPSPEFRRVILDCPGLATAKFIQLQTITGDGPGLRLISLCRAAPDGPLILVDRGFVAEEVSARPAVSGSTTSVRVEGVLRRHGKPGPFAAQPSNGRFLARDDAAFAAALNGGALTTPWTVFATTSTNPELGVLKPSAPPATFSNNHLGYLLTWFGLAIALLCFYVVLLRRRLTS